MQNLLIDIDGAKVCSKCHQEKPLNFFYRDKTKKDGHSCRCKLCINKTYIPHPRILLSEEEKKSRLKGRYTLYYQDNKEYIHPRQKRRNQQVRLEVLQHYSQMDIPECKLCKEKDLLVLCVDHIHGGGNKHRKTIRGANFYYWLRKNNYPDDYQILCANCNQRKRILNES